MVCPPRWGDLLSVPSSSYLIVIGKASMVARTGLCLRKVKKQCSKRWSRWYPPILWVAFSFSLVHARSFDRLLQIIGGAERMERRSCTAVRGGGLQHLISWRSWFPWHGAFQPSYVGPTRSRLLTEPDSLCACVLKGRYFPRATYGMH